MRTCVFRCAFVVKDCAHVLQGCLLVVFLLWSTSAGEGIACLFSVLGQLIVDWIYYRVWFLHRSSKQSEFSESESIVKANASKNINMKAKFP